LRSNPFIVKSVRKVRFAWDLAKAPTQSPLLPPKHEIKELKEYDVEAIWEGLQKTFLNEKGWIIGLDGHLEDLRRRLFPEGKPVAGMELLVLMHGPRVVGVSAVYPLPGEGPHLLSGITIDYEYQRRGLGTALLQATLRHLAEKGLETVSVVTRETVPAAKFLYPKFGGQAGEVTLTA
jgi:ribosomal protein S18 acetylase RimI-like enzyme